MVQKTRDSKLTTTITVATPEGAGRFSADWVQLSTQTKQRMADLCRTAIDKVYGEALEEIRSQRYFNEAMEVVRGSSLQDKLAALPTSVFVAELDYSAFIKATDQFEYLRGVIQKATQRIQQNSRGNRAG